jgi:hypothetical protein
MIEFSPDDVTTLKPAPAPSLESLAAAIADVLAHLYEYAGTEMDKLPPDPANELLRDTPFTATAEVDQLAKYSAGPFVRAMLDWRGHGAS